MESWGKGTQRAGTTKLEQGEQSLQGEKETLKRSLPGWTENAGLSDLTPSELALQLTAFRN